MGRRNLKFVETQQLCQSMARNNGFSVAAIFAVAMVTPARGR